MSNITHLLAHTLTPLALIRTRAKVLAREDRVMRSGLVRARRQNNLTQREVAEMLGVSPQAIQKLERYDADPKLSTLRKYAAAVGAIVEHRVTIDVGQSASMAESTHWESDSGSWRTGVSNSRPAVVATGHDWSEPRKSQFDLGA